MVGERLKNLKEMFTLLQGMLSSDEEEEKQAELKQFFDDFCKDTSIPAQMKTDAEKVKKLVESWDPIDKWFKEVPGLSEGMKDFLNTYYDEKPGSAQEAPSDDENLALLKAAGIDVDKLQASGVEIDVEKLKAVLLSQMPEQAKTTETIPEVDEDDDIFGPDAEEDEEDEEERRKKLDQSLRSQEEKLKPETKKRLIAPKIMIPGLGKQAPKPSAQEEKPTEEDKIVLNKHASKIKIKSKAPTILQNIDSDADDDLSADEPAPTPGAIKPVVGPKLTIVSNAQQKQEAQAPQQAIKPIAPQNIQRPNIAPVTNVQRPNIAPVTNVQRPNIAPVENIQRPNIAPVGNTQRPNIAPVGNIQRPNIAPVGNIQRPNIAPVGNIQRPNIAPVGDVQKPNIAPAGNIQRPNIAPIDGASQGQVRTVGKVELKEKVDFKAQKIAEQEESIYADMGKESLLNELIYLQNRQYYFEKAKKTVSEQHKNGKISDGDYRGELERLRFESERASRDITEVKTRLSSA